MSGRSVGSRRALFADWSIPLTPEWGDGDGGLTLRELIERLVQVEVEAFNARREGRRLDRVLSDAQIAEGEARGRISPEGREGVGGKADAAEAVGAALEAFEDGLYLVIIDDEEYTDLDRVVRLRNDSRVTFLRLTFLAGA